MPACSNGGNLAAACERSSTADQVRARESFIVVRNRFRRGAPLSCALVYNSSPLSSSTLTTPLTRPPHAPHAWKFRMMARKTRGLGLLMAAATAAALADQPKTGCPTDPPSVYAVENACTVPLTFVSVRRMSSHRRPVCGIRFMCGVEVSRRYVRTRGH